MNSNQYQIVSKETALLAKEKGINRSLDLANNLLGYSTNSQNEIPTYYHVHGSFPDESEFIYAPTQTSLQAWLREIHKLNLFVLPNRYDGDQWYWVIGNKDNCDISHEDTGYSFETALEVGLVNALKMIK